MNTFIATKIAKSINKFSGIELRYFKQGVKQVEICTMKGKLFIQTLKTPSAFKLKVGHHIVEPTEKFSYYDFKNNVLTLVFGGA